MEIRIAQFTFATREVTPLADFLSGLLGGTAEVVDHGFFTTLTDRADGGEVAVVPHDGNTRWDRPWLTLATDDLPAALAHLARLGVTDVENSGPTDDEGNPIACVTFRDPEGRLIMLAASD